jgi:hypothetical protein
VPITTSKTPREAAATKIRAFKQGGRGRSKSTQARLLGGIMVAAAAEMVAAAGEKHRGDGSDPDKGLQGRRRWIK